MARWRRGRNRRLGVLGGRVLTAEQAADVEVERFAPTPVDEQAAHEEIERMARGLAPGGIDEATGDTLDNLINARADQWLAEVNAQHSWYVARIELKQEIAQAAADQAGVLAMHDRSILAHVVLGLESALLRMTGRGRRDRRKAHGRGRDQTFQERERRDATAGEPGHPMPPAPESPFRDPLPGVGKHSEASSPDAGAADWREEAGPADTPEAGAAEPEGAADGLPEPDAADLRILISPADSQQLAEWGERGHSDPTMLAGRPRISYLHVAAILLAAGADIGAFYQIVELVLPSQRSVIVALVVVGFTATVLYLAHACGMMLRDLRAGARWISWIIPCICALVWIGLGAAAFVLRLRFQPPTSNAVPFSASAAAAPPGTGLNIKPYAASLFLALYVATGMVAGIGGYLSHNPVSDSYAKAVRTYRKAAERSAATAFQIGTAKAHARSPRRELIAAARTLEEEVHKRLALAETLKQVARVQMAERLQDPAVTDAIFTEDRRPYN